MSLIQRLSLRTPSHLLNRCCRTFTRPEHPQLTIQHVRTISSAFHHLDAFRNRNFRGRFVTEYQMASQKESLNVLLTFRVSPEVPGCSLNARFLHNSGTPNEKASSKIEETVNRLKEKHVTGTKEASQNALTMEQSAPAPKLKIVESQLSESVAKKTLWQKFVDECKHYYSGFKLLALDVRVSSGIVWKILHGQQLSRRESKQLVRTTSDLFRLVPFSVFIIVPFMELLLPVALKLFPGMLPSTFTTKSEREAKMKRTLKAKLEYAKFLQKTLDQMAPSDHQSRSSKSAADFVNFYRKIKAQGSSIVTTDEILKYSKLFEDDITLDNMTRSQLAAICRLLDLTPVGTSNFLRLQIEMRLRHLRDDDKLILRDGLSTMTVGELQLACKERGMRALGLTQAALLKQMEQWLDLSQNAKVPPSLLLLSRTLYFADTTQPTEQLAATISSLPESAATATRQKIGEREGKIRNVERLEQIKEEQRKIMEDEKERKRLEELKKKKETAEAVKTAIMNEAAVSSVAGGANTMSSPEVLAPAVETLVREATGTLRKATVSVNGDLKEELIDRAETILTDKAEESTVVETLATAKEFDASTILDLKTAMTALGKTAPPTEDIKTLKKELEDYEEDLKDLELWKDAVQRHHLKETKGAKRLFQRVNKMLKKVDTLVATLEQKEKSIVQHKSRQDISEAEQERETENLITVQELLDAIVKLQKTPDASKIEQIAEILSMMDVDEDGVVHVEHVVKVIELLGTEHIRIPAKQMRQIVEMMTKEKMFDVTTQLEDILGHTSTKRTSVSGDASNSTLSAQQQQQQSGAAQLTQESSEESTSQKLKQKQNGGKSSSS